MSEQNLRCILAERPTGWVEPRHFRMERVPVPEPGDGEVLVRNHWLSLDPYMRGRMSDAKSYADPVAVGAVMIGGTAGEVVASRDPRFKPGDAVVGMLGWQLYGVAEASTLRKVDTRHVPLAAYLGVVGMPGVTAWYGLNAICAPKAGETLVVTAAAGAVGGVVAQRAKAKGCRVVGVAGGAEKCRYVVQELGIDACVDYKAGDLATELKAALPQGADCLFENVGGEIFDALLARTNAFGRIALCGLISDYNAADPYRLKNLRMVLINRLNIRGFIVSDHADQWPAALQELARLVATGRLKYRESIAQGLDHAPEAFIGLLRGRNFGKQLVKLV